MGHNIGKILHYFQQEKGPDGAGTEPCQITGSFITVSLLGSYLTTLTVT
jgi:hypothetical protein